MKGLYYNGTAAEYREDLPMPVPEPGESLIKFITVPYAIRIRKSGKDTVRHSAESWDMNL